MYTMKLEEGRGCGFREEGSAYLCTGTSENGLPADVFVVDPVAPMPTEWTRGYTLIQNSDGINHVLITVGKEYYKSPWDFVEESRFGISRKVNDQFPWDKITPNKSMMLFAHKKAMINGGYKLARSKPFHFCNTPDETKPGYHIDENFCTHSHRDLAWFLHNKLEEENGKFTVKIPSVTYTGNVPEGEVTFEEGIFMYSKITHVEFKDFAKTEVSEKISAANIPQIILDY